MGGICSKGSAVDKSPTQTTHTSNKFKETADIVNTLTSTAHVAKEQDGDANFFSFSPTQLPNHVNSTAKDPRLSRIFSYKSRSYNSTKTAGTATTKVIHLFMASIIFFSFLYLYMSNFIICLDQLVTNASILNFISQSLHQLLTLAIFINSLSRSIF